MGTFVLVHGAWHGGWCWKRVAPLLRAAGHDVYAPTLSGVGERAHLASPAIGLQSHIDDIIGLIEKNELDNIILVGHSYGGMVITGVAERLHSRISDLVYLDAFVPKDGQSLFSINIPERVQQMIANTTSHGDGWRVPAPPPAYFGVKAQADIDWITRQCTPQSLLTFMQPVRAPGAWKNVARKAYIRAAGHPSPTFAPFEAMAKTTSGWTSHEVACGHEVMIEMPRELTEILLGLA